MYSKRMATTYICKIVCAWLFVFVLCHHVSLSGVRARYDIFSQLYNPYNPNTFFEEELSDDIPKIVSKYSRRELKTRFTGDYNGSMFVSHGEIGEQEVESPNHLSYETTILKTGKRIATFIGVEKKEFAFKNSVERMNSRLAYGNKNSEGGKQKEHKKEQQKHGRSRRNVYGRDDRSFIPITNHFGLKEPYVFSVRLSTGCTGILISPRHVLTAAHCVHDQKDYVKQLKDMKVGFLQSEGTIEWIGVKTMKVSKGWIEGGSKDGPYYDYALLKLKKKHTRPFIRLSISESNHHGAGERISFSGFDDDKPSGTMWYRSCSIVEDDPTFLYHYCDAKPGSSGSGVYSWIYDENSEKWERELIGVFSGNRWRSYDAFYIIAKNFNVAVRLTRVKYAQICKWMGSKVAKKVCKDKIRKK